MEIETGNVISSSISPEKEMEIRGDHPGWAEQDADEVWRKVCEACQQLWIEIGDQKQKIAGLAVTSQRGTIVNIDGQGEPLRPAISWLDQRRARTLAPLGKAWELLFRAIGQRGLIDFFRRQAESNWIRAEQPELWERTEKFLLLSGYLHFRLCGKYVDSVASQVGYIPFSYKDQTYLDAKMEELLSQEAYWVFNARLAYRTPGGGIEVAGWVQNFMDEEYKIDAFDQSRQFGQILEVWAEPRTYGVTVSYSF